MKVGTINMMLSFFKNEPKRIYLDYAATTPVDPEVLSEMEPYFTKHFGNPGSVHAEGQHAKQAVAEARAAIATEIGAHSDEILFTSGGTEANNMAIHGVLEAHEADTLHLITSAIEHPSVLEPVRAYKKKGVAVSHVGVNEDGRIDISELKEMLTAETVLISIMYVSNEIGSIQPITELMKVVRKHRKDTGGAWPYVHVDASQAPLFIKLSMEKLGIDLMTLDAQKIYGPKGVGLLYRRRGVQLEPLICGGDQEYGLRGGTENVPLIVGFARALALAEQRRARDSAQIASLRDYFVSRIREKLPQASINGGMQDRVPSNVNFSLPGFESSFMVVWLDARGIACGSRSACMTEEDAPSYVIEAMGGGKERAESSLRFTLGRSTTRREIDRVVDELVRMSKKLTD